MKATATLAILLVSGCAMDELEVGEVEGAIHGGMYTDLRPEVAQFFPPNGGVCTAVMISPRTFVTAGHCIYPANYVAGGTLVFEVATPFEEPVAATFLQGGDFTEPRPDDLAYGELVTAHPYVTPATIATTQPSNTFLTAIGYGCTSNDETPAGCMAGRRSLTYYYAGQNTSYTRAGDGGSPVFQGVLEDGGAIVRIQSHRNASGSDYGVDAVAFRDHIMAMSNALNGTGVGYRSHVQSQGWQPAVQNGSTSGTWGQSLRLEGLQVWLEPYNNSQESFPFRSWICYQAYVQDYQWQDEVCDGALAGTVGQGKRIEAIKMRYVPRLGSCGLHGIPCKQVHYSVYLEGMGWQGPYTDGQIAGTIGQSRRVEAVQIQVY